MGGIQHWAGITWSDRHPNSCSQKDSVLTLQETHHHNLFRRSVRSPREWGHLPAMLQNGSIHMTGIKGLPKIEGNSPNQMLRTWKNHEFPGNLSLGPLGPLGPNGPTGPIGSKMVRFPMRRKPWPIPLKLARQSMASSVWRVLRKMFVSTCGLYSYSIGLLV